MPDPILSVVDSLDTVPEPLRPFYSETDSGFTLNWDGAPKLKSAAEKARSERDRFERELKDFREKYDGLDPDEARKALDTLKARDAEPKPNGNVQPNGDAVNTRELEARLKGLEQQLAKATAKAEAEEKRAAEIEEKKRRSDIRDGIRETLRKHSDLIHPDAEEDILLRATMVEGFSGLDEQGPFLVDGDGEAVLNGDGKPTRPEEWLIAQLKTRSSWRRERTGTGGRDTSSNRISPTLTPERLDALILNDPAEYARMRKAGQIR